MDRYRYLKNLILIYGGVVLSLSLRLISDNVANFIDDRSKYTGDIIDYICTNKCILFKIGLMASTILYFIEDIIDVALSETYKGTIRLYIDVLIFSLFYLLILLIDKNSAYYLIILAIILIVIILWAIQCIREKIDTIENLTFIIVSHTYGAIIFIGVYFTSYHELHKNIEDIYVNYLIILWIWIVAYHALSIVVLKEPSSQGIGFLPQGLIRKLFIKIAWFARFLLEGLARFFSTIARSFGIIENKLKKERNDHDREED